MAPMSGPSADGCAFVGSASRASSHGTGCPPVASSRRSRNLAERAHVPEEPCVLLAREDQHGIVGISDQESRGPQPRLHLLHVPGFEHLMQDDVRQKRRDDASLRGSRLGAGHLPGLHHPRLQPLVDRAAQHAITHPLVKKNATRSTTSSLSTLRSPDCAATTQDSVPTGGQPWLGGIGYTLGLNERFQIHVLVRCSPFQGFACRPSCD